MGMRVAFFSSVDPEREEGSLSAGRLMTIVPPPPRISLSPCNVAARMMIPFFQMWLVHTVQPPVSETEEFAHFFPATEILPLLLWNFLTSPFRREDFRSDIMHRRRDEQRDKPFNCCPIFSLSFPFFPTDTNSILYCGRRQRQF